MKKKLTLMMAMVGVIAVSHAQWQLTGNSISATDFLGSTNAQPLVFKVNNQRSGLIDFDDTKLNTALGYQTLLNLTTGFGNSALGYQALLSNTSGSHNVAAGRLALSLNTTGGNNVALGIISLRNNTTGSANVAIGSAALWGNISGINNVAVGLGAIDANISGNDNAAVGYKAAFSNNSGYSNVAMGSWSLFSNTFLNNQVAIGDSALFTLNGGSGGNTAVGSKSLFKTSSGSYNTAHGYQSLFNNTTASGGSATGYQALYLNSTGNYNTANGYQALYTNTTGYENTAVGYQALYASNEAYYNTAVGFSALYFNIYGISNTALGNRAMYSNSGVNAHRNTAIGDGALYSNLAGSQNTACGASALFFNSTGNNNTAVGYSADISGGSATNSTVIGYLASGSASNQVRIGNSSVTSIGGFANWTNVSDKRFKKNVQENVPGLQFINQLRPVTYNLDISGIEEFLWPEGRKDYKGNNIELSAEAKAAMQQKEQLIYTGFIAQEVEAAARELGYTFSGVDAAKHEKDMYGLRYAEFVVPLVKSVQELSRANDSLKAVVNSLQLQINEIKQLMRNGRTPVITGFPGAYLKQNAPNPFYSQTLIDYFIPESVTQAQFVLTDMAGRTLQTTAINNRGAGQLSVSAGSLPSGTYIYSLITDGKKADSKQLILTK